MAKKDYRRGRNYRKRKTSTYSVREKQSFKRGFLAGLFSSKKKKTIKKKNSGNKGLLDKIKFYRDRNLGVLYHNGKFYDTNFVDRPHELDKKFVKELHSEYDVDGKRSDIEVADMFVRHMRRKYGSFDSDGNFKGMLGE